LQLCYLVRHAAQPPLRRFSWTRHAPQRREDGSHAGTRHCGALLARRRGGVL
jgi:hypothetical protein